jgi:hypothetical protein
MKDSRGIGRRRHLTPDDVAVSMFHLSIFLYEHVPGTWQYLHGSLDKSCDAYLDELKEGLEEICGVSVSHSTVWRSLQRSGYSMKKVCNLYY